MATKGKRCPTCLEHLHALPYRDTTSRTAFWRAVTRLGTQQPGLWLSPLFNGVFGPHGKKAHSDILLPPNAMPRVGRSGSVGDANAAHRRYGCLMENGWPARIWRPRFSRAGLVQKPHGPSPPFGIRFGHGVGIFAPSRLSEGEVFGGQLGVVGNDAPDQDNHDSHYAHFTSIMGH